MRAWLVIALAALLALVPAVGGAAESGTAPLSLATPAAADGTRLSLADASQPRPNPPTQGWHTFWPSPLYLPPLGTGGLSPDPAGEALDPLSLSQAPAASRFRAGPFRARLLALPGSALLASFPQTLSLVPGDPGQEPADDALPEAGYAVSGGFLALELRRGPVRLTLGGGLLRSYAATGGTTAQAPAGAFSLSSLAVSPPAGETSKGLEPYNRWAAFVAVPYRLSDRMGLTPELSYHHAEDPEQTGNEWVMGLRFSFGF